MMRRVACILALVVFGAVAQTGVAYVLNLLKAGGRDQPWPKGRVPGWPVPVPPSWKTNDKGRETALYRNFNSRGWGWDWTQYNVSGGGGYQTVFVTRIGWPLRSLVAYRHAESERGRVWVAPTHWVPEWEAALMRGEPVVGAGSPDRVWPMYPLWRGFAVNTAAFAAAGAGLWYAAAWAKRSRRHRRGLCVACGYELAGLAMCPECGRAQPCAASTTPQASSNDPW